MSTEDRLIVLAGAYLAVAWASGLILVYRAKEEFGRQTASGNMSRGERLLMGAACFALWLVYPVIGPPIGVWSLFAFLFVPPKAVR